MKTIMMTALAVSLTMSPALAGDVVWRSTNTGVLTVATVPGTVPDPDENGVSDPSTDFGISYPVTTTALAKPLMITPSGPTSGVAFEAVDGLPPGLTMDNGTGEIVGVVVVSGTHTINVRLIKSDAYQVVPVVIIAG